MAIGTKFTGYTALSSTDPQLLGGAALEVPDGAKSLLAAIPFCTSPAGDTANEPVVGAAYLNSEDIKGIQPFYMLAQPIGSALLKSSAQPQGDSYANVYPINCSLSGGESIKCYGYGLFNHTIEPYMSVLLIYSDQPASGLQYFSKIGTFTNTGTAAARVSGGTISIVGGKKLRRIFGLAV